MCHITHDKHCGCPAIFTDSNGRPYIKPERDEFPAGIEGTIAYLDACYAWKDARTDACNRAFAEQFRKTMREGL